MQISVSKRRRLADYPEFRARLIGASALGLMVAFDRFYPWETYIMVDPKNGIEEKAHADRERSPRMSEQYNAILYLGPPSSITMSTLPKAFCADAEYMQMRERRAVTVSLPALAATRDHCLGGTASNS